MTVVAAWVVGRGLLGKHLESAFEAQWPGCIHRSTAPHAWHDESALRAAFSADVAALAQRVRAAGGGTVLIAWTAGLGVIGSPHQVLARDEMALRLLLDEIAPNETVAEAGMLFVASTAGGAWGGSADRPITERSAVAPITEYGHARLRLEDRVGRWLDEHQGWRGLIGRISTLYGPGQNLHKAQGFISQVSRAAIFDRPINVFVSLDTLRDFLFAPDCAALVADSIRLLLMRPTSNRCELKIFADEQSVSLLQVVAAVTRVCKHQVRVTTAPAAHPGTQAPALVFRSVALPEPRIRRTDLIAGVYLLYQHQLRLFREGRLAPL